MLNEELRHVQEFRGVLRSSAEKTENLIFQVLALLKSFYALTASEKLKFNCKYLTPCKSATGCLKPTLQKNGTRMNSLPNACLNPRILQNRAEIVCY